MNQQDPRVLTQQPPPYVSNGSGYMKSSPAPVSAPAPSSGGLAKATMLFMGVLLVSVAAGGFIVGRVTAPSKAADTVQVADGSTNTTALKGKAADAAALVEKGLALHVAGQTAEAAVLYKQALEADPKNKFAYFNLGQISQTNKDLPAAIASYKSCLAIDPGYLPALYNLGLAYASSGNTKEALETFQAAHAVAPDDAKVMFSLGRLLVADGKSEDGTKLMADALQIDPSLQPTG